MLTELIPEYIKNIHTNRAKHDFAKRCIEYDIQLLINNTSNHIKKKNVTLGFTRYAKMCYLQNYRTVIYAKLLHLWTNLIIKL